MLAALGDLVEDVVVRLRTPINVASDTEAVITRRRGGSAANVTAAAAGLGAPARFLGQVGDDAVGRGLLDALADDGVDTACVRVAGATGTIVVLVDAAGERTMLTDRRTCVELADPDPVWLDGVAVLHVPLYSFGGGPLADTATTLVAWAHARSIVVSVDVSSVALLGALGDAAVRRLLDRLGPTVVLANRDEAAALGVDGPLAGAITIVKQGPRPAIVHRPGAPAVEVTAHPIDGPADTTGAGDAFAAGLLTAAAGRLVVDDPVAACAAGHDAAARLLTARWAGGATPT